MGWIDDFKSREEEKPASVKAGALNVTIIGTTITAVAAAATLLNSTFDKLFGKVAPGESLTHLHNLKLALLVALIAAGTIMVVADVLARAKVAAAAERGAHILDVPADLGASVKTIAKDAAGHEVETFANGYVVKNVRVEGDTLELLVSKNGETFWKAQGDVKLAPVARKITA